MEVSKGAFSYIAFSAVLERIKSDALEEREGEKEEEDALEEREVKKKKMKK